VVYIGTIMEKIRMNVYLDPRHKEALEAVSKKTGAPVAELVRRAIDAYLAAGRKARQRRNP
jgi:predicted DNA-binding protein